MKICMFVTNNCKNDSRVLKEAKSLAEAGHDVRIVAILDKDTELYEERDGFRIIRVIRNPVHYRILNAIRLRPASSFSVAGAPLGIFYLWNIRPIKLAIQSIRQALEKIHLLASQSFNSTVKWLKKPLRAVFSPAKQIIRPIYRLFKLAYRPIRRSLRLIYRPIRRSLRLIYRPIRRSLRLIYGPIRRFLRLIYRSIRRFLRLIYRSIRRFLYMRSRSLLMIFHRPLSLLDYYMRSWEAIKNEPADVYHCHDLTALPAGYIAKRRTSGKLLYDCHDLLTDVHYIKYRERLLFRLMEKCLIHHADEIITISGFVGDELKRRYKIGKTTAILNCPPKYNGVELPLDDNLRRRVGVGHDVPIITYIGLYGTPMSRGVENLILAMPYVEKGVLAFVAWGSLEEVLKGMVKDMRLEDRVFFTQPVSPDDVVRHITSANVGAITPLNVSLNHYYSHPNKFFEYIGAGLPVVSSNFPALTSIIEGYHLGKTCNPEDPRDIAAAINWVLADKERYKELRINATKAAKVFNWETETKKLLEIYRRLMMQEQ